MWALHNLNTDTHLSQLRVSCPCSLVWLSPLYVPSPAHSDFALGQHFPLPLSGLSPRLWPAQPWLAVAFPFWEFHLEGRHYPSAAMKQNLGLNFCIDPDVGSHECLCTCLWALPSCSRLFSRKLIFCFWLVLISVFSESKWEFYTEHTGSFTHTLHLHLHVSFYLLIY